MIALHIKMNLCYRVRCDEFKFNGKKSDPLPLGSQQNAKPDSRQPAVYDVSSESGLLSTPVLQTLDNKHLCHVKQLKLHRRANAVFHSKSPPNLRCEVTNDTHVVRTFP